MNETDMELLRRYAFNHAEDAFSELVQRHLGLVYSAALRQVQSPDLAREVAQSVFIDLARNANKLPSSTILTAWLYQVARRTAIDVVRRESRRHLREQTAHELLTMNSTSADWAEIEPLLDEAMQSLGDEDRSAVLLRFFANKSLREVGEALGTSENAAQKRLTRAVDRLNEFFTHRGIRVGAGALAIAISTNAVQAIPTGLGLAITAVVAQSAATTATAVATSILTMSAIKNTAIAVTLFAAISAGIYQAHHASELKSELDQLKAKSPPAGQFAQLTGERDEALRQLAALKSETRGASNINPELLRLRDEVSRLKREAQEAAEARRSDVTMEAAAKNWLTRLNLLKARLQQTAEAQVPEMQLLNEEDWLAAVKDPNLETDQDFRKAFATLRNTAQGKIADILQPALNKFLKANNAQFPTDLSQLLAYCEPALDPAMLNRYAIQPSRDVPNVKVGGDWAITQKEPIDPEFDSRIVIGADGHGSASYPRAGEPTEADLQTLKAPFDAYIAANGREPADPTQVEPYLTTPEQKAAYQKVLKSRAAKSNNTASSTVGP